MTTFDRREQAFEARFAHDEEVRFRLLARRNRGMGLWAADKMKLSHAEAEAYADRIVEIGVEAHEAAQVIERIAIDLRKAGTPISIDEIRRESHRQEEAVRASLGND